METRLFKEIPPCVTDIELVRGGRELIGEGEASSLTSIIAFHTTAHLYRKRRGEVIMATGEG